AYATYFGRALRWAVFLRPLRPHPGIWNLVKATIIGFTAIVLLGRPGEFVRPYLISVKEGVPLTSQLAAWFLERIFDLLVALFIFGYGLSRLSVSHGHVGSPALQWLFQEGGRLVWILSALCLGLLVFLRHYPELFGARLIDALGFLDEHRLARVEGLIASFLQGVESIRSTVAVALALAYTVLEWILIAACYFCILKSFNNPVRFSPIDIFIYMGFVAVGTVIQLPRIAGGVQGVPLLFFPQLLRIPLP